MSAKKGTNYTNNTAKPAVQSLAGECGGVKRVLFDQLLTGGALADVISLGKVPKGARILEVKSVNGGSGGAFNVSPAELLSSQTVITFTVGNGPSDPISAWVEYVID